MQQNITNTLSRSSRWRATRLTLGLVLMPILLVIAVGAALSGQPCGQILQLSGWIVDASPKRSGDRRS